MLMLAPLQLSAEEKLDALRYLDEFRFWHSLDDRRRCKRCHQEITGRQLLIFERYGTRGGMRLHCPTPGCRSSPNEWVYADPVLAGRLKSDFRTRLDLKEKEPLPHPAFPDPRPRRRKKKGQKSRGTATAGDTEPSLHSAMSHMPLLRSLATHLHGIRPVA